MIFDDAIEQVLATKEKAITSIVKLGTVTSVSGGRAYVRHYGDSAASTKQYTYIDGYFPEVDDTVAMLPQGNTWIIIGKVMNTAPVEKYATKTYVDTVAAGLLPVEYKNKLEDSGHTLTLSGADLLAGANEDINLGSLAIQFAKVYSKEFYENGVRLRADGILVVSGGNTYSLLLSYASSTATLTPSSDNVFALGSSSKKFKEAWLGLFRGSWKSGQSTERQVSWNSSNALVPDTNESVDLGTSSLHFKDAYLRRMIGALAQSSTSGYISWASATSLQPSANNSIDLGASGKQFNKIYANEFYINGVLFDGTSIGSLKATYGSSTYSLDFGANNYAAYLLPSWNKKTNLGDSAHLFQFLYLQYWSDGTRNISWDSSHQLVPDTNNSVSLGSSSLKYSDLYVTNFYGAWRYTSSGRAVQWDNSNNIYPDTTNTVSLGTSSRQYKNIYGQNIYVNGTAVSSDRRVKDDIKTLEEKHIAFFKALRPVQFKYKEGDSGRTHTGFIAQEVEEAVEEAGMTSQDMAVVVKDPSDRYYLRYEEIISVQTKVIQDLMAKVESLEARITKLEGKGENK